MKLFEFYRRFARAYLNTEENRKKRAWEVGLFEKYLKSPVLDLAGGAGVIAKVLEAKGFEVVLADYSHFMLATSDIERRVCCDAKLVPFKDESFYSVLFWGNPYPHFSFGEILKVFEEIKRVLKRGGVFITAVFDLIKLGVDGEYKIKLDEGDHWSEQVEFDPVSLKVKRVYRDERGEEEFEFYLWSPAFVKWAFEVIGFEVLEERTFYEDKSWLFVCKK